MSDISQVYPRHISRISQAYLRLYQISKACLKYISGKAYQAYLRHISDLSQSYPRHMPCISQPYLRSYLISYLKPISGKAPAYIKHISGIFKVHFRHISGIAQIYVSQTISDYISNSSQVHLSLKYITNTYHRYFRYIIFMIYI